MNNDNVFFATEDYVGEKFTSTSANYTANLAKESCQYWQSYLDNLSFYNTKVALIGSSAQQDIQIGGVLNSDLGTIGKYLDKISQANSLIAWLREAIKAKKDMLDEVEDMELEDYCERFGIEVPKYPQLAESLTEKEYYQSLPIKERNEYYSLEAEAATIGKVIHPKGSLSNARNQLKAVLNNPNEVKGSGRDTIIYSYYPTADLNKVDETFFELQQKHRSIQARLNGIKHHMELAVSESKTKAQNDYKTEFGIVQDQVKALSIQMRKWKDEESARIRDLKIILPNSLKPIYEEISKLGK